MAKHKPQYDLSVVQELITNEQFIIVKTAKQTASQLGFNQERIKDVILQIRRSDFNKSERDWQKKGHWQDAYKPCYEGIRLYLKWKIIENNGNSLLLLSFKEDEGGEDL